MDTTLLDSLWVMLCCALVFAMQAGFLCLESGLTRSRNSINVAMKNLTDFAFCLILFWAFGYGLMFGRSWNGFVGLDEMFLDLGIGSLQTAPSFLFQAMFCATAATIISGAVAERMRYSSYVLLSIVVAGLIYPVFGHWAWGGSPESGQGWLAAMGFVDFAGSTVVHGIGGWAALAAVLVIGPRAGRFVEGEPQRELPASNLPMAMLGTLLLWVGWIGFNGGSYLKFTPQVSGIIANTMLAASSGMVTAMALSMLLRKRTDVRLAINGTLAGLVAITAGCHAVTSISAVLIGAGGAVAMAVSQWMLSRFRIDDAIDAVPTHAVAGLWGTAAVALFGMPEQLGTGLSRWDQLLVQLTGGAVAMSFGFGVTYVSLRILGRVSSLRVTREEEHLGLNVVEHGESTENLDLLREMEEHRQSGDFSQRVTVDPSTELGQIAGQYNRVLDRVAEESEKVKLLAREASDREQLSRTMLDAALDCIIAINQQGIITEFNPAAERTFGHERKDAIGKPFVDLIIPAEHRDAHQNGLQKYLETGDDDALGTRTEMVAMRSDGREFPVELAVVACPLQEGISFTAYLRDLTEKHRAEMEQEETQRKLVEASRQAGMSEVANGVLHNVGNVLNSVNVSASVLGDNIRSSSGATLNLVADTVSEHEHELATFLTEDKRGQHFPRLLRELATTISAERDEQLDELSSLVENIAHIKEIIGTQQSSARVGGATKPVDLERLVKDALKINAAGLEQNQIQVVTEFDDIPQVKSDKHKILQILINLIGNARQAVVENDGDRIIRLTGTIEEDQIQLEVRDSGVGISEENLKKIFSHGFTTKDDGHGFGLHSSALAAEQMGGSLSVHSDGPGEGACFTLTLPAGEEVLC